MFTLHLSDKSINFSSMSSLQSSTDTHIMECKAEMSDSTPHTPASQQLRGYLSGLSASPLTIADSTPTALQEESSGISNQNRDATSVVDFNNTSPSRRQPYESPRTSRHWTRQEKNCMAVHLNNVKQEDRMRGLDLYQEISRRMTANGYDRSASSIMNMQNRLGSRSDTVWQRSDCREV